MIKVAPTAWKIMIAHAESHYPNECCGILVGTIDNDTRQVAEAIPMRNAYQGAQEDRFEMDPAELRAADEAARAKGLEFLGTFHSHPDCDAYFSKTDLANCVPWVPHIVMSVKAAKFDHANAFQPNLDQTEAVKEELSY
jgi:proteasome lid subunit RPN8/RPN11